MTISHINKIYFCLIVLFSSSFNNSNKIRNLDLYKNFRHVVKIRTIKSTQLALDMQSPMIQNPNLNLIVNKKFWLKHVTKS